jgi:adenine-specific DNA-methyltransferase
MNEQDFIKAGFTVVGTEASENKLLSFLKENYPNIIRDTEINLEELKTVLGLPIDEKVNGYGLNFVGRNFARAKYAQKTENELRRNTTLSKNIDTTENLVLKGDNLDSLKILKNHYSGQIKCIYIDPPYNTDKDEFVYPDKFDKEEAEVLGLANVSESDFARMDFSFKTKKSHNGWLAFMYPRLLLARDLLSKSGVIFISIDDNEQANLKLLCDDVFGEENFVGQFIWKKKQGGGNDSNNIVVEHEYIISYSKSLSDVEFNLDKKYKLSDDLYPNIDENGEYGLITLDKSSIQFSESLVFEIKDSIGNVYTPRIVKGKQSCWRWGKKKVEQEIDKLVFKDGKVYTKYYRPEGVTAKSLLVDAIYGRTETGNDDIKNLFNDFNPFSYPKPTSLVSHFVSIASTAIESDIILDFFAGSGTTGQAIMQLNAEDGGNRKFILCQIDEPIDKKKPAYQFCIDNNLPPVISSITVERLKRSGEKIAKEIEGENKKVGLFEDGKKQVPDIGFKVFDSVEAPKLKVDEKGQISISENETDALSRIYNMIFTIGLDEPTQVPEEVVKDSIYKIGNHYYIINCQKITSDDYSNAIKNGKVFIDGWTASLNGTLQNYKEDVKIVF